MIEAVDLAMALHRIGLRMDCSFIYFLQIGSGKLPEIELPKINPPIREDNNWDEKQ